MIDMLYDVKGVSTTMVFAEAAKQGLEFIVLDNPDTFDRDFSAIELHPDYASIVSYIRDSVDLGRVVTMPEKGVWIKNTEDSEEGWFGYGWTVKNPVAGSGGYLICGGVETLHNEIINGGSGTTIIAHPLSRYETGAWLLVPGMGAISSGLGKIVAGKYVFDVVAVTTTGTVAGSAFLIVGSVIGLGLMCVGVWAIIQIFKSPSVISILIRSRKRYAYA